MTLTIEKTKAHDVLKFLRDEGFDLLLDIAGVDGLRLGRAVFRDLDVAQLAHDQAHTSNANRSYSFSLGIPQTACSSRLAGRMMTAPDDSMWCGGCGQRTHGLWWTTWLVWLTGWGCQ